MGAPIGEAGFEEAYYAHKVSGSVGRVDETVRLLQLRSPCALHALTYASLQHLWDYRLRCCSGSPLRGRRLAGAPRPACWAARLGACAFVSPTAGCPVTMLHVCTLFRVHKPRLSRAPPVTLCVF